MNFKKSEQTALLGGILTNFIMSIAGIIVYNTTQIEALFVDVYFSMITLVSGIISLFISKFSTHRNKKFPDRFSILEPLYSLFQSILTIILLSISLIKVGFNAYQYFFYGHGELMNIDPIVPYEIVMVLLSLGLSYYYNKQNKKINNLSTMLFAEAKGS